MLEPYFPTILQILFQKLEKTPSDSFKQRLVRFYHLVSAKLEDGYGADYFIRHAMSLQENVFVPLYLQIILPTTEQFARPIDRKLAVISLTMTLCHSAAFAERYAKGWRFTCEHMLKLLRNPPKVAVGVGDEVITEADVDDIGFGLGFTPLNTCKQTPRDDFPNITSIQAWVGEHMRAADASKNGMISKFAAERLSEEGKSALAQYFA